MTSRRRIIPQPGERWLLRDGGRCYALPASLGRRLRDGEAVPGLEAALAETTEATAGRSLWIALPLLPARTVAALASILAPAASWVGLAAAAVAGAIGCAWTWGTPVAGVRWPIVVAALLAAGLVHELGHAAALVRGGGRPGAVGVGALFVFPVLFCDVTAAALLSRADRARVDVAGVAWHLAVGGALAVAGRGLDLPGLTLASWGVLAAATWSALPFLRTDGYWLLCDLLGLEALESPAPDGAGLGLRYMLAMWRVGSLVFLGVIAAALAERGWWLVEASEGMGVEVRVGMATVGIGLACLLVYGLARRSIAMIVGLHRDVVELYVHNRYTGT